MPKQPKLIRTLVIPGFFALSMGACAYNHEKGAPAPVRAQNSAGPAFATVRDQVLAPRCVSCHKNFTDYAAVFSARDDIRDRVFVKRNMPKGRSLSADQSTLLQKWLDAGAPEQSSPGTGSDTSTITPEPLIASWDNVQKHFFVPYCAHCHGSPDASAGYVYLLDLETVRLRASSILDHVLVDQNMPPNKASYARMTTEAKDLLVNWIAARMPGPDGQPMQPTPAPSPSSVATP